MGVTDREVYEEIAPDLMRYATALVGPDHAPDVVSTVVTRALHRSGGLAGLDTPKTYLMKAVLNEATGIKRQRARRQTYPMATVPEIGVPEVEVGNLDGLVMELPPQQRAAAYLVFFLEYSPTEAAQLMGKRPGTVRRYLHLARRKLEAQINEAAR
jgi:RNA polymerase sigma-70 factor (ECF subfamily)